ncbi:hypothetical protein A2686_04855 [Candidatus Woesebacteria bacterium RIFCSPHIGHO2_01_FULL_38_10]|uniref:Uncharacterized protein n=1 Tax=Candidatus Woesebacteria bacterium RIFCSPLOWO2_01_FULL_39_10b TaxID=1802517 RepID=A0A1F8B7J3_9BACT|nr:MAG: hypothetical protein A2686_04855 [Candidatus Woesebacteria bacterium RIFCSPHIGHO2_01_FULL_38_10]OGM59385.1 MAG: hypothetical protein A2892_03470 [Candidatus Woesebacteria bacterium RIFCSPLOWO2_01_FULL_39_10b]
MSRATPCFSGSCLSKRKFGNYLRSQGINPNEWEKTMLPLLPVTKEVHFQIASPEEQQEVFSMRTDGFLGQAVSLVKTQGGIPIVCEIKASPIDMLSLRHLKVAERSVDFIKKA